MVSSPTLAGPSSCARGALDARSRECFPLSRGPERSRARRTRGQVLALSSDNPTRDDSVAANLGPRRRQINTCANPHLPCRDGLRRSASRVHSLRGERDDGFLTPSKATPGLLQSAPPPPICPTCGCSGVARIPVDFRGAGVRAVPRVARRPRERPVAHRLLARARAAARARVRDARAARGKRPRRAPRLRARRAAGVRRRERRDDLADRAPQERRDHLCRRPPRRLDLRVRRAEDARPRLQQPGRRGVGRRRRGAPRLEAGEAPRRGGRAARRAARVGARRQGGAQHAQEP